MKEIKCYKNTPNGLELVGVVDDYESFSFTRKYSDCGEWQLVLNGNTRNAKLIKDMDYISMGSGVSGVVEQIENNVGENNQIIYSGSELKGITSSRIVMPSTGSAYLHLKKNPALVILDILNTQIADCEDVNRNIPNTRIDSSIEVDTTQKIEYDGRFGNVYEEIASIATAYGIGWYADIEPLSTNNQYAEIVFYVYSGIDRKQSQSVNSRFVLSYSNDNIEQSNYQYIDTIPNTALVAGQGEGIERALYTINNTAVGLDRKEVYIDARDIEDNTLLPQRGNEKLAEYGEANSYQITLSQNLIKQYHSSFELGDIGTIQDELLDLVIDFRLTEITEIYESDDFRLEVVCGYDKKDLGSAIKRSTSNTENLLKVEGNGSGTDLQQILNLVYPVGSIYMAVNSVNPSTLFGGTWVAWGSGKVPVGIDTSDTDFNTVEKEGGSKELQKHNHKFTPEGTIDETTATGTIDETTATGTIGNQSTSHTHTVNGGSCTTGGTASKFTVRNYKVDGTETSTYKYLTTSGSDSANVTVTGTSHTHSVPAHTHTVGNQSASHNHTFTGNAHKHTFTGNAHKHNFTGTEGTTENTGTGESGNLQPYITCYMWKRTA